MFKFKLFVPLFCLLFLAGIAFAQEETPLAEPAGVGGGYSPVITEAVNLDENVQPEDLGVSEPQLLPDSPLYFLKNWTRGIQSAFTFNPVKKAELRMKFANEKLMEAKKIAQKTENPEIIKKATENYRQEVEKVKNQVDKIKERAAENPQVESFLDKFIHQQTLHQKLLQKLENQVPPEAFEKIKEAREKHLEIFQDVMLKLEDRKEKITEKLDEILGEQTGSQFKNFKNLEVLKDIEEKVPEEAKEAIQKAQENALKRLKGDLEKMSPEDQEKFKEYIERISGEKEKQLEILENLKAKINEAPETPKAIELKEKLEEGKIQILEKIEKKLEKLDCPSWTSPVPGFCKEGRVIIEKNPETGCPLPPRCIIPEETKCEVFITCEEGYIPYNTGQKDNQGCPIKKCIKKEEVKESIAACITLWDPVCGKNGKTYSNACFAKLAGVEIAYKGVCEEKEVACAKEGEKVNRNPLMGPTNQKCCEGLKEIRVSKSYSICQKEAQMMSYCDWCGDACVKIDSSEIGGCPTVEPPEGYICTEENSKCVAKYTREEKPETPLLKTCKNLCGDGVCQEVVCMAIGCPCPETRATCPADCK